MVKKYATQSARFVRGHWLSFGIVAVFIVAMGAVLASAWLAAEETVRASDAALQEMTARTEKRLAELAAKKKAQAAEEQRLKEAAEAEAAKKAAEEEERKSAAAPVTVPTNCNPATAHVDPTSIDVVVNKKHCLKPIQFVPPDLVTSHGATLSAKAIQHFNELFAAAAAAGQPFTVTSSYRSYATQVSTYNHWVSVNGQAAADTVSARPGFSEHQTGFVIDVGAGGCNLNCFGSTSQYQWFQENAATFGFIQRYYAGYEATTGYAGEEWHYRYVGPAVALDMKAKGVKTLEQYWGIEGGNYR